MENAVRECGARAAKEGAKGVRKGGIASRHTGLKDSVPLVVAGEDMAPDLETQLLVMTAEGMRRLSRAQREAHLDAELQNRFTICTPFNVVERVYRLSCKGARSVSMCWRRLRHLRAAAIVPGCPPIAEGYRCAHAHRRTSAWQVRPVLRVKWSPQCFIGAGA